MDESRRDTWERAVEWPLTAVAILFLGAYAWPILDPSLSASWTGVCRAVTWVAWVAFGVDYVARLALSRARGRFIRHNVLDLAVVVLPLLRPLRLLRLVRVLSVLNRAGSGSLRGRVIAYVVGATALTVLVASLAVLEAERRAAGANITSFGDAVWWSFTTVTTVGYGDRFPVTGTGRFVAVGLMVGGIALLGVVTASFASWLIERVTQVEEATQAATRRDVEALTMEVAALRRALGDRSGHGNVEDVTTLRRDPVAET